MNISRLSLIFLLITPISSNTMYAGGDRDNYSSDYQVPYCNCCGKTLSCGRCDCQGAKQREKEETADCLAREKAKAARKQAKQAKKLAKKQAKQAKKKSKLF